MTDSTIISPPVSRRLYFGGSFNPIHYGHLRCVTAAARARNFGAIVLIPSAQPPHKPLSSDLASAEDRLAMTKLAAEVSDTPGLPITVDDLELCRSKPSYTIDTAQELKRRGWTDVTW